MRFDSSRQGRIAGFTIIEVMIVVGIVGILAAIAIPNYSDYLVRGRLVEAAATLSGHRVKMEQFYQDNRTYTNACAAGTVATAPATTEYFQYACNIAADGQSYTISATGLGSLSGFLFTIDQSNNRATTISGTAASKGYTSSATCWVRKKPNLC
ncbi:MAG TPA: type IV pilin protein [Burkholderiales bacterium]|nr:type IV pilin protein [Burkholderiales bacterium]